MRYMPLSPARNAGAHHFAVNGKRYWFIGEGYPEGGAEGDEEELRLWLDANQDTLGEDDVAGILALQPGQMFVEGGGAAPVYSIERLGEGSERGGRTVGMGDYYITMVGGERRDPMADEGYSTVQEAAEALRSELGWGNIVLTEPYRDSVDGDDVVAQSAYETADECANAPDADPAPQVFRAEMEQNARVSFGWKGASEHVSDDEMLAVIRDRFGDHFDYILRQPRPAAYAHSRATGWWDANDGEKFGMYSELERILKKREGHDMHENARDRRVPGGRQSELLREPDADRMIVRARSGMDFDVDVRTLASRDAVRRFLKDEAQKSSHGALGRIEWSALVKDVVPRNMLAYPHLEREDRSLEPNARKGSGWQEYDEPQFAVGDQVKLTGTFLRSTGQIAGGEGGKVWTVMGYSEYRGKPDYTFVLVDEPVSDPEMYEDLPPEERPKYRLINAHNLMPARGGKMKARYFPNHEPNARRDAEPDEHAATELLLYIENEADLSPQGPSGQGKEIAKNLLRKMAKGKYDHALAPKLWLYLVETGGKRYSKEFGGGEREWSRTFTPATRDVVAQALADQFRDAVAAGDYESLDYRTGAR